MEGRARARGAPRRRAGAARPQLARTRRWLSVHRTRYRFTLTPNHSRPSLSATNPSWRSGESTGVQLYSLLRDPIRETLFGGLVGNRILYQSGSSLLGVRQQVPSKWRSSGDETSRLILYACAPSIENAQSWLSLVRVGGGKEVEGLCSRPAQTGASPPVWPPAAVQVHRSGRRACTHQLVQ